VVAYYEYELYVSLKCTYFRFYTVVSCIFGTAHAVLYCNYSPAINTVTSRKVRPRQTPTHDQSPSILLTNDSFYTDSKTYRTTEGRGLDTWNRLRPMTASDWTPAPSATVPWLTAKLFTQTRDHCRLECSTKGHFLTLYSDNR